MEAVEVITKLITGIVRLLNDAILWLFSLPALLMIGIALLVFVVYKLVRRRLRK